MTRMTDPCEAARAAVENALASTDELIDAADLAALRTRQAIRRAGLRDLLEPVALTLETVARRQRALHNALSALWARADQSNWKNLTK